MAVRVPFILVAVALAGCLGAGGGAASDAEDPDPPQADHGTPETVIASGHIWVGSATTNFRSTNVLQRTLTCLVPVDSVRCSVPADGIDSFFFDIPAGTATLSTHTTSSSTLPFNIQVFFRDENWAFMTTQTCATGMRDEHHCPVPTGAVHANADATSGIDLTVSVVTP